MIQNLFSLDIYNTKFEDSKLLEKLSNPEYLETLHLGSYSEKSYGLLGKNKSGLDSWHKFKDSEKIHLRPEFNPIKGFIEKHAKIYWDYLGYYNDISPKIYQSWANLVASEGDGKIHNHGRTAIAGVLYLSASSEQGNIVFENPMDLILSGLSNLSNTKQIYKEILVTTGTLLLFPGYLKHFTLPNKTNFNRISYAFNLNEDGSYINKHL
jgi:uncharacterized protein (TIGR02466 family)